MKRGPTRWSSRSGGAGGKSRPTDRDVFMAQLQEQHPRLRALALRVLNDHDAADDALQEAYVKAYRNRHSFRGESTMATWLHTVVYRCCLDQYRRRRPAVSLDAAPVGLERIPSGDSDGLFDQTIAERMTLRTALEHLNPSQRAAIWLVDGEGMTFAMAAEVLDLPPGTVGSRVSRARATLRKLLTESAPPTTGGGR